MFMKKLDKLTTILLIFNILMGLSMFILYGPFPFFRDFWITSAMTTRSHQYLAYILYDDKTIREVMANNTIIEVNEAPNTSLINKKEPIKVLDRYERRILDKDKGNDLYKVINIEGSGYKGHLVAIYDPSKISLALTKYHGIKGQLLTEHAKANKAKVAINASGFNDSDGYGNGGTPTGSVVKEGKLIYEGNRREIQGGVIGFDYNNNLILTKENMRTALTKYNLRDAVEFGPFLIVNGKPSFIKGNGGWGLAPRTAIGQRSDGIVLFLIIDGRQTGHSIGADMVEMTRIMTNYKAINAANLDGGASTSLVVNEVLVNKPFMGQRPLPNAWIVTE